jgi:hypothetical protein
VSPEARQCSKTTGFHDHSGGASTPLNFCAFLRASSTVQPSSRRPATRAGHSQRGAAWTAARCCHRRANCSAIGNISSVAICASGGPSASPSGYPLTACATRAAQIRSFRVLCGTPTSRAYSLPLSPLPIACSPISSGDSASSAASGGPSVAPEVLEPSRAQFCVAHCVLDRNVPQPVLDRPRVSAGIRQCIAATMAQHVTMHGQ